MRHGYYYGPCFERLATTGYRILRSRSTSKLPHDGRPTRLRAPLNELFNSVSFRDHLSRHLDEQAKISKEEGFTAYLKKLRLSLRELSTQCVQPHSEQPGPGTTIKSLRQSYETGGDDAVNLQLKYFYFSHIAAKQFSDSTLEYQRNIADLRFPEEWYPATRCLQRKIHLHVGPTNSGKTYHALKRLEAAKTGVYGGPLRMLAYEVYSRLNAKGIPCDLVTGDERIEGPHAQALQSCTVEMIPLNLRVDVAVVDEIQMIGDDSRGWAWTQALLGLQANELHLCGEERTVPLIRELCSLMGDELEIHTYKRLSPLRVMSSSLRGSVANLRKGDCVVVFSRLGIHAMKREIEKVTRRRAAIVYGGLPPEIRAQQASLFNDPDNEYDFLVASDAIGMGLNLAIKRIVFEATHKRVKQEPVLLSTPEIKQIAGRAGRFRTANSMETADANNATTDSTSRNIGLVTTFEDGDLPILKKAMRSEPHPIMSAGLFPPTNILMDFAAYFPPSVNFSFIMQRLHEIARLSGRYKLCRLRDQIGIADAVQPVENLTVKDKIILCAAPCPVNNLGLRALVTSLARCIGDKRSGALLDIPDLHLEVLDQQVTTDRGYLDRLETLHKGLILYLWLSYRFKNVFVSQKLGFHVKGLVEERIERTLTEFSASRDVRRRIQRMKEQALKKLSFTDDFGPEPRDDDDAPDMEDAVNFLDSEMPAEPELLTDGRPSTDERPSTISGASMIHEAATNSV